MRAGAAAGAVVAYDDAELLELLLLFVADAVQVQHWSEGRREERRFWESESSCKKCIPLSALTRG